ncbi:MAG: hypothetical protein JNM94_07545 [Phycisphaerae bacterium]|nr:hypothetical protein [Phycisphaerae bacterium]
MPSVDVGIDPLRRFDEDLAFLSLLAEATGSGRLALRDGDVLAGRIVCEGLDVAPGARLYVAADTELLVLGDGNLDIELVPLPDAASDDEATVADGEAAGDGAVQPVMAAATLLPPPTGPISPSCPSTTYGTGKRGKRPPKVQITFAGNWVFNGLAVGACAGPAPVQTPIPGVQLVVGAKSAKATGGQGGAGMRVTIRGVGDSTLTIGGALCNGHGANGADAFAIGLDGDPCTCGGDAYAVGGQGGDAGTLDVSARTIVWDMLAATLTLNPGGAGGAANAIGGAGGDCDQCGGTGGRGGHATAIGGRPGKNGRISVRASQTMLPAPEVVLGSAIFSVGTAADGGIASAEAGSGGRGGDCFACAADGGPGGPGGNAFSRGADGASGVLLAASVNGAITAYYGSDAGDGGNADASAGLGGTGGLGGDCLCSDPQQAGDGGEGGLGGSAAARGGVGGDARGGKPALALHAPTTGDGGDASAFCGEGGDGGTGGWCLLDTPELCTPGNGGAPGGGGQASERGGKAGKAKDAAAMAGVDGVPLPEVTFACAPGFPGVAGSSDCPRDPDDDCCVPGNAPGCGNVECALLICQFQPFCCDVVWDVQCAEKAQALCPSCNGGGGPSDCCVPHPWPGCGSPPCMNLVCQINPICCEMQWDANCATLAQMLCGGCGDM